MVIAPSGIIQILGDFVLGENIKISVAQNAILSIGGKKNESASGITSNSIIACKKEITIGTDLICSWNVFVTDCNWHTIYKRGLKKDDTNPVNIGNHTWIGSNTLIGPGTVLGENCIIGAFTKLSNTTYPSNSTICGIVPKIVSSEMIWSRDI